MPAQQTPRLSRVDELGTTPVVIAGGARELPASGRWSLPYLKARLGSTVVRYKKSRGRAHPDFTAPTLAEMFATGAMPFADFLDAVTTGPTEARARMLMTGDEHF